MRLLKLFTVISALTLFIAGCNSTQTDEISSAPPYQNDVPETVNDNGNDYEDDYIASENLDLQAVGDIFKESDSAEDFERRLNTDDGVNNIDLNGDGYADYISVEEYEDRDTGYRGFSLFDRFGGTDAIQEIATIILDRTLNDGRGSRLYINGNDQIYGDNYNYQADWQDTTLNIVNWAFGDRNEVYRSPYYYDNYPDYYETYRVIETPVYRNRVRERYYDPVFIQVNNNDFDRIKIKSPYKGKSYDKIYAKLAKPNDFQKEFRKNNRKRPDFVADDREKVKSDKDSRKDDKGDKRGKDRDDSYDKPEKGKKNDFDKPGKVNKPEKNDDRNQGFDKGKKDKGGDKGNGKNNGGGKGKN